jgi:hypothetical protein
MDGTNPIEAVTGFEGPAEMPEPSNLKFQTSGKLRAAALNTTRAVGGSKCGAFLKIEH